jgi:hypothetical protein
MAVVVMILFDCYFLAELTILLLGLTIYCLFNKVKRCASAPAGRRAAT